jgi:hypothetical protein
MACNPNGAATIVDHDTEYKGFSSDGAAAGEFIDTVEDLFVLHQTPESEKVVSVSRAFPLQAPAKS